MVLTRVHEPVFVTKEVLHLLVGFVQLVLPESHEHGPDGFVEPVKVGLLQAPRVLKVVHHVLLALVHDLAELQIVVRHQVVDDNRGPLFLRHELVVKLLGLVEQVAKPRFQLRGDAGFRLIAITERVFLESLKLCDPLARLYVLLSQLPVDHGLPLRPFVLLSLELIVHQLHERLAPLLVLILEQLQPVAQLRCLLVGDVTKLLVLRIRREHPLEQIGYAGQIGRLDLHPLSLHLRGVFRLQPLVVLPILNLQNLVDVEVPRFLQLVLLCAPVVEVLEPRQPPERV
mmetsp:Transcript_10410/g.45186  ORF Transcript_10410/g.45186 Transcript_10410/m.45186 type:complete len:286 (-) Transcript_10410:560-1417(-)